MENIIEQFEMRSARFRDQMAKRHAADLEAAKETGAVHGTWQFENLMLSYIRDGETEKLRAFLAEAAYRAELREGILASDPLRQAKNLLIGLTALVGKVAGIGGGMDVEDAYRLIDIYTQECEAAADVESVMLLQYNMVMDFTEAVRQTKLPANLSREVYSALQYIAEHSHEAIGIDDVAAHVDRSRSYITRRFREEIGLSINEYIIETKIRDAKRFLRYSDRSLGEIAAILAFSSQAYFQTVFRKKTGLTPGEYRKKHSVS